MRHLRPSRRTFVQGGLAAWLLSSAQSALGKVLGYPRSLAGPMVGATGPDYFSVWVRATGSFPIELEYSTSATFATVEKGSRARASGETENCVVLEARGLRPGTHYYYRLRFDGELDRYQPLPFRAKTAPAGPADFTVAFGSCCRIQFDRSQPIFHVARRLEPDMFFWLGDNIYADTVDSAATSDLYSRQRTVESLEPLLRSTPQLATWDDHDFGFNDSDGSNPFKQEALRLFRSYWANPSYGSGGLPGVWFKHSYGGVDFFFLDGRYYRDPSAAPDTAKKTMLGAAQKAWLKAELQRSRAPFKVLVTGGGWSSAEQRDGGDSWGVYIHERDEIFDFIRERAIGGVFCISGDSHMGELNCIPRSAQGGYDMYDFCSSPLAQMPAVKQLEQVPELRIRDVWSRSVNVGFMRFEMGREPRMTYTLHDVLGKPVWDPLVLTPADLTNGVRSWDRLADPEELERLKRHRAGRGYYGFDPS
jgi:alkaline phosphatase D